MITSYEKAVELIHQFRKSVADSYEVSLPEITEALQFLLEGAGVKNEDNFIYLKGDADTDGSMRIIPDLVNGLNFEFQLRTDGVWNDTGIDIAASTIHIGRDLKIGAAGDYIHITDRDDDFNAIVPFLKYSDAGTGLYPQVPILGEKKTTYFQTDDTTTYHSTLHSWTAYPPLDFLVEGMIFKTGAIAATAPVKVRIFKGVDNTGELFFEQNYPPAMFPANTEVSIVLGGMAEFHDGEPHYHEISSDVAFDLVGTALPASHPYYHAHVQYLVSSEDIMTSTTGMDRILIDINGEVVSDISGNLMLSGNAPS
jgi:hypothetical protein